MSDEGEFAERWRAARDAAGVHEETGASTGPMSQVDEVEPGMEQPPGRLVYPETERSEYGSEPAASTEPRAFDAWETSDSDSVAEGRVVFSTPVPEERLDFSLPDFDVAQDDGSAEAAVSESPAPAEDWSEFSSSDYLSYDVSQGGAAGPAVSESAGPAEDRLGFSSSNYLSYDPLQGGAAEPAVPESAGPAEDRLGFSSSDYSDYLSYDVSQGGAAEPAVSESAGPAEDRSEFSSSDYLSYDPSWGGASEGSVSESAAPAEGRLEFSSSDYLSYDVSQGGAAEPVAPESAAPAEDRLAFSSSDYLSYDPLQGGAAEAAAPEPPVADRRESTGSATWEGSLFDGSADTQAGDERYVPAMPSGPSTPPRPGTPSSGNLRLPEWMREESGYAGRQQAAESGRDEDDDETGRSRVALIAVVVLVVALVAAAVVYFLRSGDESPAATPPAGDGKASTGTQPESGQRLPARKALRRFPGTPTAVIGQYTDVHAGLAYPRFGAPWQAATKRNKLGQLGWSGQQVVVTEQHPGAQLWYGQALSGTLGPGEMNMYGGPGTEEAAAIAYAKHVEDRFYGFPHRSRPFASQPLTVSGHKGWLVSSYLQYRRPGIRASAELIVTAVIDTGRQSPAVLFMAIPNTHRALWPDINYLFSHLKVAG